MPHKEQDRFASIALAKLRATLVTKDQLVFSNSYEGTPTAGAVKIPFRATEVEVSDYSAANGIDPKQGSTDYKTLLIDKDKAVNEVIDKYQAEAVPDNVVADRLDSAGYSLGLNIDKESLAKLVSDGTELANKTASTPETIYEHILAARVALSKANVPTDKRFLIVSPEVSAMLLRSPEYIKAGDLSQDLVAKGVIGQVAGFNVFESNNIGDDNVEFIAGHPNWCHRVIEWQEAPALHDLNGSSKYVGASAIKARMIYGLMVSNPLAVQLKKKS